MPRCYHIKWSAYFKKFLVILVKYDPMVSTLVSKHDTYLEAVRWTEAHPIV